jgi:hypothetical protein
MTMLGGDLYLHSWGLTWSNPIWSWNLKHTAWISEWSWPISWYFRWIHDTGWRFQSSSAVLVLFFVIFHPRSRLALQISKAMAEPSKSPTLVSVESKSSRRRKSPPKGSWTSWCCEENGNEKLIMCHARWKMQHENASKYVVAVSVAICSLIYKCAIYGGFLEYLE